MTKKEYIRRRQKLLEKMIPASAALIFSSPRVQRNADIEYPYRQNSNFLYFTGFKEPEALLILIKSNRNHHSTVLFNRVRNNNEEIWTSRCLGQKMALEHLGIDSALPWDDITNQLHLILNGLDVIYHAQGEYSFADRLLFKVLKKLRCSVGQRWRAPTTLVDWRPWVYEMRMIKSEEELMSIRRACEITALAHTRAMQKCLPDMYEYQLESEIQYEFIRHGARFLSYDTIVGSGKNSYILHYTENSDKMKDGDLVLIDAGCEYQGYASDVTRTFPVNGRFSQAQRTIYNIVLAMFNYALTLYRPGCNIQEIKDNERIIRILITNLIQCGVIKGNVDTLIEKKTHCQFFLHGITHWLGLDVHDVGEYSGCYGHSRILEPGMVLTIEPGIYIAGDADVPEVYRGISVRIEDNIIITESGNENLTASIAKEADAIEAVMARQLK